MHYNPNYDNISEALGHEDGLMVMGFFLKVFFSFFVLWKYLKTRLEEKEKVKLQLNFQFCIPSKAVQQI